MTEHDGRHVDIGDVRLWVVERGPADGYPVLVLHGGPGLDHHMFGDYLDPLLHRTMGQVFLVLGIILVTIGSLWIKKIGELDV